MVSFFRLVHILLLIFLTVFKSFSLKDFKVYSFHIEISDSNFFSYFFKNIKAIFLPLQFIEFV